MKLIWTGIVLVVLVALISLLILPFWVAGVLLILGFVFLGVMGASARSAGTLEDFSNRAATAEHRRHRAH